MTAMGHHTPVLESLFSEAPTKAFFCECCKFLGTAFLYRIPRVAAFLSTRKGRRGKRGTKELGKKF